MSNQLPKIFESCKIVGEEKEWGNLSRAIQNIQKFSGSHPDLKNFDFKIIEHRRPPSYFVSITVGNKQINLGELINCINLISKNAYKIKIEATDESKINLIIPQYVLKNPKKIIKSEKGNDDFSVMSKTEVSRVEVEMIQKEVSRIHKNPVFKSPEIIKHQSNVVEQLETILINLCNKTLREFQHAKHAVKITGRNMTLTTTFSKTALINCRNLYYVAKQSSCQSAFFNVQKKIFVLTATLEMKRNRKTKHGNISGSLKRESSRSHRHENSSSGRHHRRKRKSSEDKLRHHKHKNRHHDDGYSSERQAEKRKRQKESLRNGGKYNKKDYTY